MITHRHLAIALFLFAAVDIGSGLWRYLTTTAGHNGLYFGLVTGGVVLVGALLAWFGQMLAGRIVGGLGVAMVLMWFCWQMYGDLKEKFEITEAEIRKTIVVLLGLATFVVICLPGRSEEEPVKEVTRHG